MLGANWRRWSGYRVASSYDWSHDREYAAIRNAAALLDISPLYKYLIGGRDAARLLDRVVTRNVRKMQVGQVIYTPWCDDRGKTIDDGTISRIDEERFRLTSAEPAFRFLNQNAWRMAVSITDVTEPLAALALQGPSSRAILAQVVDEPIDSLGFFRVAPNRIAGVEVEISRTGYTGDLGYELWIPATSALRVWDELLRQGVAYGITPAGIWALDVARIEAGLVMADVDYHSAPRALIEEQKSSPFELSLDWAVNLDKEAFNGKQALVTEQARGIAWRFMGIEIDWHSLEALYQPLGLSVVLPMVAWRASVPVYRAGVQIGYASSGVWSPLLKKYLALAHIKAPHYTPGTAVEIEVTVEHKRRRAAAWVRKTPFFDPPRKKA